MAVKKVENFNIHETPAINQNEFDVETYLNANWGKTKEAVNNNAEELMQVQKDISTLKEDNKTNKESIETLQAENLEIKAENERLREDIKSIATIGEASGENIHLEDSSDARCKIEICGNHQQDTREGYNKLDSSEFINSTQNGVTLKVNLDGTLTLNGTATADTTFRILRTQKLIVGKANLKVIINQLENAIKTGTIRLVCQDESYGNTVYSQIGTSTFGNNLKEGITYNIFSLVVFSGTICNNLKLGLVISENKTDYEQYGASPSLDYPSPVKSVGDNANLFPGWEMGTIDIATGNKITDPYYIRSVDFISILPNIDYTIYSINSFGFDSLNTALRLYDKDKKYLGSQYLEEILEKNLTFKITNLDARFMIPTSTNGQKNKIPGNAKVDIKLEKGIIATPYSSYNCGSAKIDIFNKNIFKEKANKKDIKKAYINIISGILNIKKGEIYIISFDTNNNQGGLYLNEDIFQFQGQHNIRCDGKRHYLIGKAKDNINKNVTILKTIKETTNNYDISNVLVTKYDASNVDTKYIEHQEQSYLVDVQQEMLKGDTFVRQDGKWYEKHNWITLLNENIINNIDGIKDESKKTITTSIKLTETPAERSAISNILTYTNNWNDTEHMIFSASLNTIYCLYNKDRFSELNYETIKKEIGEFDGIIKYKSNKSTYLECTKAQSKVLDEIYNKAHTYKNITNISVESAEVNPIASVKYLKDAETEHNKLQAQIDEIKQLLSTTETSALLVNNLEKDLRMEVE
mgnify:CR=1 FL=1